MMIRRGRGEDTFQLLLPILTLLCKYCVMYSLKLVSENFPSLQSFAKRAPLLTCLFYLQFQGPWPTSDVYIFSIQAQHIEKSSTPTHFYAKLVSAQNLGKYSKSVISKTNIKDESFLIQYQQVVSTIKVDAFGSMMSEMTQSLYSPSNHRQQLLYSYN